VAKPRLGPTRHRGGGVGLTPTLLTLHILHLPRRCKFARARRPRHAASLAIDGQLKFHRLRSFDRSSDVVATGKTNPRGLGGPGCASLPNSSESIPGQCSGSAALSPPRASPPELLAVQAACEFHRTAKRSYFHVRLLKSTGNWAGKRGARMALGLRDVQCDPIANRALNELMHHYAVAEEKSRLVLTKKAGNMKLFLYDLDDLHQLDF